ncbi:hypothetical protein ACFC0M_37355 [Streptomyces sp. NPDC056149]|uniref:hypothetical protein n=1 Tax=unclassified Streptomyces TaxID=2593676 RepID=UPI00238119F4|nr:hypothetical protein [Streptomyces sp. WZ-12]
MKALLWLLLVAALVFNLATYALWDGSLRAVLSLGSGAVCLACAGGLRLLRGRRAQEA